VILIAAVLAAGFLHADPYCSANGKYCVEYGELAGDDATTVPLRLIANGEIARQVVIMLSWGRPLVSDDGRFIAFTPDWHSEGEIRIMRWGESDASSIPLADVATPNDLIYGDAWWSIEGDHLIAAVRSSIDRPNERENIEIDLERGKVLTPIHDIYPLPHVYIEHAQIPLKTRCGGDPSAIAVSTSALLDNLIDSPMPDYPVVAQKARVGGHVFVTVVIDERGEVACVETSQIPFGVGEAARAAVKTWTFRRFRSGGKVHRVTGTFTLVFRRVEREEWKRISRER
jgi:hypothetical protein